MMKKDMRLVYGEGLRDLGREDERVVVLEADLGKSTMSNLFGAEFPQRYFQMGIAEANMVSAAAGLALTGKIPFVNSFAVFATGRPYDQIRSSVCIPRLNVKICGSSAGLSDYGDGKTHQSMDDIALMRTLPGMTVFSPADAAETGKLLRAMKEMTGPCYLRVNRNGLPVVTDENDASDPLKVAVMREGTDAVVYATGYMVYQALQATDILAAEGISLRVINVRCIKPLDVQGICQAAQGVKFALTAEEASIYGGLGSAVCEALSGAGCGIKVERMGIQDCFGTSAQNYDELMEAYHLTAADLAQCIRSGL